MRRGKKDEKEEEEKEEKRREEEERKGRGRNERERGREKEKRERGARGALPSADAFPSMKLGNNITPIKGRLGKNTTPTCRRTAALTPNLQKDPQQRRQDFCDSSYPDSVAHQGK